MAWDPDQDFPSSMSSPCLEGGFLQDAVGAEVGRSKFTSLVKLTSTVLHLDSDFVW